MKQKTTHSPLYTYIQTIHGNRSWDRVLDAGTGWNSLRWLQSLPTKGWTAVTVDPIRTTKMLPHYQATMRPTDHIVLGNWEDPTLLQGEQFDVVLVDYLIGAIDAFTPYFQDLMLARLRPHTQSWLYLIGLEPTLAPPKEPGARLLYELDQFKDACRIHAGKRPYREYPAAWVTRRCEEAGFVVEEVKHFPRLLRSPYIDSRAANCRMIINDVNDLNLRKALHARLRHIEEVSLPFAKRQEAISLSTNYVLAARLP